MDIIKRLEEHNGGISTFTAKAKDWIVKWKKAFETRGQAMFEEKRIKNKKSRKYIEWLIAQAGYSVCCPESLREKCHRFDSFRKHSEST
jgi:putative endonuclease